MYKVAIKTYMIHMTDSTGVRVCYIRVTVLQPIFKGQLCRWCAVGLKRRELSSSLRIAVHTGGGVIFIYSPIKNMKFSLFWRISYDTGD